MNAVPPSLRPDTPLSIWSSLHHAGTVLAALAEVEETATELEPYALPRSLTEGPAWRRELFERFALDARTALQPGIIGLAALVARGADPRAAAQALWAQFLASREALVALARQNKGPPRQA
jgi:hypothetical protein